MANYGRFMSVLAAMKLLGMSRKKIIETQKKEGWTRMFRVVKGKRRVYYFTPHVMLTKHAQAGS